MFCAFAAVLTTGCNVGGPPNVGAPKSQQRGLPSMGGAPRPKQGAPTTAKPGSAKPEAKTKPGSTAKKEGTKPAAGTAKDAKTTAKKTVAKENPKKEASGSPTATPMKSN